MSKTRIIDCTKALDLASLKAPLDAANAARVVDLLLDRGLAIDTPVGREYEPALLRWLVKHGASSDLADRAGVTTRQKASRKRDKRFVAALE